MTLSAEQFNKIALKGDLEDLRENMMNKQDKEEILSAIDKLASDGKISREERASNQAAHDRIQGDINEVRKHIGLNIKHPTFLPEDV